MTTADEIRGWTRANLRARLAYHRDATEQQQALARAKAVRKAEAQQRYRDRQKEKP